MLGWPFVPPAKKNIDFKNVFEFWIFDFFYFYFKIFNIRTITQAGNSSGKAEARGCRNDLIESLVCGCPPTSMNEDGMGFALAY